MMESSRRQAFRHYQGILVDSMIKNGGWGFTPEDSDGKHRSFNLSEIVGSAARHAKKLVAQEDEFMRASTETEESN